MMVFVPNAVGLPDSAAFAPVTRRALSYVLSNHSLMKRSGPSRVGMPLMTSSGKAEHGMAYDSKRDRLLLFSGADKNKGDVMA